MAKRSLLSERPLYKPYKLKATYFQELYAAVLKPLYNTQHVDQ